MINSGTTSVNRAGIQLEATADYCTVTGNQCFDDQGTKTQSRGIREVTGADFNVITGNNVEDNDNSANILLTGSSTICRNNMGFVTENSGTGTINSGATSVTITHGLEVTPTADDISVVLAENPTNDPGNIWIDTIGSTTFIINCRSDPGSSNLDVAWRAEIL